jgi:hypothetical protein
MRTTCACVEMLATTSWRCEICECATVGEGEAAPREHVVEWRVVGPYKDGDAAVEDRGQVTVRVALVAAERREAKRRLKVLR